MSPRPYGIGVIGSGYIWSHGHWQQGLQHIPHEAVVRYVYDTSDKLAQHAAAECGATVASDADAILASPDVDIVTIATPPYARVEYVRQACAAGKHLMLEKPMARTLDDALSIVAAIGDSGVKCFVPFSRALNAAFRNLVSIIESGELGEPLAFIHANLGGPYGWVPLDHWMHDMEKSGGPIFDYSIHFIELARACMVSEAKAVTYVGKSVTGRVESDDHAVLTVEYESGALGEFTKSWAFPPGSNVHHQATHVVCRDAVAVLDRQGVTIHTRDGVRAPAEGAPEALPGRAEAYRNLIASIEDDTPLHASELEGLRTNEILDAALRSRETGRRELVRVHN
jgi:predicted dehydrogenase